MTCTVRFKIHSLNNEKPFSKLGAVSGGVSTSFEGDNMIETTVNFTATVNDNGRRFTCQIGYSNPPPSYIDTCMTRLIVHCKYFSLNSYE